MFNVEVKAPSLKRHTGGYETRDLEGMGHGGAAPYADVEKFCDCWLHLLAYGFEDERRFFFEDDVTGVGIYGGGGWRHAHEGMELHAVEAVDAGRFRRNVRTFRCVRLARNSR
jgi:hypothetical protein